jgi:hypothetical protein
MRCVDFELGGDVHVLGAGERLRAQSLRQRPWSV